MGIQDFPMSSSMFVSKNRKTYSLQQGNFNHCQVTGESFSEGPLNTNMVKERRGIGRSKGSDNILQ